MGGRRETTQKPEKWQEVTVLMRSIQATFQHRVAAVIEEGKGYSGVTFVHRFFSQEKSPQKVSNASNI